MIKNVKKSCLLDSLWIKKVDKKYPITSEINRTNISNDLTLNIYLSKNHTFGNLLDVLIVKQNPKLQMKVPTIKYVKLMLIKHLMASPIHMQIWPELIGIKTYHCACFKAFVVNDVVRWQDHYHYKMKYEMELMLTLNIETL